LQRRTIFCRLPTLSRTISALIELKQIHKHYSNGGETVRALDGVDAQIAEGEFVAIMGRSGSGKSTMLNILGCMDQPSSGCYLLDGHEVSTLEDDALAEVRGQTIGFVFQSFHLLPRLSALNNVMLPLRYSPKPDDGQQRAEHLLNRVGLGDRLHHRPNEMSGGQRQRVAIARALINEPSVLLADEPTGNLDSSTSDDIMGLLQELHENGQTLVMVTHEPEVAEHAGRTITMRDGKIIQ